MPAAYCSNVRRHETHDLNVDCRRVCSAWTPARYFARGHAPEAVGLDLELCQHVPGEVLGEVLVGNHGQGTLLPGEVPAVKVQSRALPLPVHRMVIGKVPCPWLPTSTSPGTSPGTC